MIIHRNLVDACCPHPEPRAPDFEREHSREMQLNGYYHLLNSDTAWILVRHQYVDVSRGRFGDREKIFETLPRGTATARLRLTIGRLHTS